MRNIFMKSVMLTSASCVALAASAAHAQSVSTTTSETAAPAASQTPDTQDEGGLSDIIVTAQRRAQNQQNVPIAITTVTAQALVNSGVTTTDLLTSVTPGLQFSRQANGAVPYIRGIGTQSVAAGVESAVATYVDGVYYMSATGNVFAFNNVDRVEVLKGPQGTLFGRNATGGLISVITRTPTLEPHFEGHISYGNYETIEGSAYASGGSGNFAMDLAVQFTDQGKGFGRNVVTNTPASFQRDLGLRSKVVWNITPDDTLTGAADWSRDKSTIGEDRDAVPGSKLALGFGPIGGYDIQSNFNSTNDTQSYGGSLKYEHKMSWGAITFMNALRYLKSPHAFDLDTSPAPVLSAFVNETGQTFQSELLLTGSVKNLDFTTGLFFLDASSVLTPLGIRSGLPVFPFTTLNYDDFANQKTRSYAVFAQGTYAITPTTKFTVGARYTEDERTFTARRVAATGNPAGPGTVLASRNGVKANYPKLTWRFALDQELAPRVLVYGSYDRGFKSGQFNTALLTQAPVRPETLDAFAVGLKSEILERTLRANISLFHYNYKNIQLSRLQNGTLALFNAASGKVDGGELELLYELRLSKGTLQLSGSASYLDSRYTSFPGGPVTVPSPAKCTPTPIQTGPATGGDTICSADLTGNDFIRAPKFSFNLGFQYSVPVGFAKLMMSANYFHTSKFFWEPDNRLTQPSYDLLSASAGLSFGEGEKYSIRVFGRNLTKSQYAVYTVSGNLGDTRALAPPRTYGVELGVNF